jgi:transcription elongation GreA/GreB family factor
MGISEKQHLFNLCQDYVTTRIEAGKAAIQALQASANEETKSSAGDKYETGRAMAQLEIEKYSAQLSALRKQQQLLETIVVNKEHSTAQPGSLVTTNHGIYFISISAGLFTINEEKVFCISASSPIGAQLLGLKAGGTFSFNQRNYKIEEVV